MAVAVVVAVGVGVGVAVAVAVGVGVGVGVGVVVAVGVGVVVAVGVGVGVAMTGIEPWWVVKARAEIGVKRFSGPEINPRITYYDTFTTLHATDDSVPWCSAFMNYVFGVKGTRSAAAISWATWGSPLTEFKPGCICVFKRPGGHHVAIGLERKVYPFESPVRSEILCLGGNQGPGSAVCMEWKDEASLIAMRWPE